MLFPKPPQDAKRIKNVLVSSLRYNELMSDLQWVWGTCSICAFIIHL